jgi:signal transduction histidine kinase
LIACEIHDELGQVLTALKIDLSWLGKKLSEEQKSLSKNIKSMITLVDHTIYTVKRIAAELRPGLLDDLGLAAAIEWQVEEFQSRTGTQCDISLDPEDIVRDKDRSTAMFRIF